ncbi:MAG: EVE domain-containing protein [Pseudomonadota bacterium]
MRYWLMKSEPDTFGMDHLAAAPKQTTSWEGVRNYQARNMLRDDMKVGDLAFFYHSSCPEPGIAGVIEVVRAGYPDASAWNRRSPYYDPKSPENKPLWYTVDVKLQKVTAEILPLAELRLHAAGKLDGLSLLRRGNRLSITPVDGTHWKFICGLMR